MPDQVIELSVDETNRLRAKLGLAPLRRPSKAAAPNDEQQVLNLSVDDTNDLRHKLGLKPLKTSEKFVHRPADNPEAAQAAKDRIEQAALKRKVEQGIAKFTAKPSLGSETGQDVADWARQLKKKKKTTKKTDTEKVPSSTTNTDYQESDLHGLHVAHNTSELQENSTTILTLADSSLLKEDVESQRAIGLSTTEAELENVNMRDTQVQQDGLKKKRQMELGVGRAGGYAGYDDDEFEELGGTIGPSRAMRGGLVTGGEGKAKRPRGFEIGTILEDAAAEEESDLFSSKAISLQSKSADIQASDYMTVEEAEALKSKKKKKKKKDKDPTAFSKKKKKKKHKSRTTSVEDDEDVSDKPSLLEDLQNTAAPVAVKTRKRRRNNDDDSDEDKVDNDDTSNAVSDGAGDSDKKILDKRARYKAVMAKGNERTIAMFASRQPVKDEGIEDEEPDDAFLNAALSKARRLSRLKNLTKKQGADTVVQSLKSQQNAGVNTGSASIPEMTISFAVDETREFTRALQARQAQKLRQKPVAVKQEPDDTTEIVKTKAAAVAVETVANDSGDEDVDMEELAKDVKEDEEPTGAGLDGTTGTDVNLGRGIAGMLGLLRTSGELSRKNAGKEELRGRARDERTYGDYDDLDLSKVVKLDEKNATEKDKEMAKKQIKLEYRDKYGRLQTRRDAYRDLSQQFHGFKGSSNKRKEERKQRQIAGEQKQTQAAGRQAGEGGILGALRATQQATGKAFVVHKT